MGFEEIWNENKDRTLYELFDKIKVLTEQNEKLKRENENYRAAAFRCQDERDMALTQWFQENKKYKIPQDIVYNMVRMYGARLRIEK